MPCKTSVSISRKSNLSHYIITICVISHITTCIIFVLPLYYYCYYYSCNTAVCYHHITGHITTVFYLCHYYILLYCYYILLLYYYCIISHITTCHTSFRVDFL